MTELILGILLQGSKIFAEERQRYFEKKLFEAQKAVKDAENARNPHYNDAKLALAKEELELIVSSYSREFEEAIKILKEKGVLNA